MRVLADLRDSLTALAYPASCQVCGAMIERYDDGVACAACWTDAAITPLFNGPLCARCGLPVAGPRAEDCALSCGACAAFAFTAARACGAYAGAIEASILFLKSHPHLCRRLRQMILRTFAEQQPALAASVIVPVPLHRRRRRERGFNQAELIAKVLARAASLPLAPRLLTRVKPTERHRAGLDARDRARSVAGAFRAPDARPVLDQTILLVDDLFTTGSTLAAAARALLDAGARRVNVLTVARVVTGGAPGRDR
ncbi:MAG TPA: double zinc ribbon domain-containing protein [Blastocatellia bacterium]|nr:double zinc ribbon domain-containing protein [Blastocatellia bacterium]